MKIQLQAIDTIKIFCKKEPTASKANAFALTFAFASTHWQPQQKQKRVQATAPVQRRQTLQTRLTTLRKDRRAADNSTYKKLAVQWFNEVQFFNQTFVQVDSFVLRNRQLLIAANRYMYNCRSPEISKQPFFLVSLAQTKLCE